LKRCAWAATPLGIAYHDAEWGVPVHDDRVLFEFLLLEGAQAGLSWETILRKRAAYRRAFSRFAPKTVARYGARDVARLMADAGIVRNRAKITSAITNAKAFLAVAEEHGSFDAYVWRFRASAELSRDLRKRGFRFVGPTICESFMEAVGLLDHHEKGCFRRSERRRTPMQGTTRPARRT